MLSFVLGDGGLKLYSAGPDVDTGRTELCEERIVGFAACQLHRMDAPADDGPDLASSRSIEVLPVVLDECGDLVIPDRTGYVGLFESEDEARRSPRFAALAGEVAP